MIAAIFVPCRIAVREIYGGNANITNPRLNVARLFVAIAAGKGLTFDVDWLLSQNGNTVVLIRKLVWLIWMLGMIMM